MTTIKRLECDECKRSKVSADNWIHLEERFESQTYHSVEAINAIDVCGPRCLINWIAKQKEKREHYSPKRQWDDSKNAEGWET